MRLRGAWTDGGYMYLHLQHNIFWNQSVPITSPPQSHAILASFLFLVAVNWVYWLDLEQCGKRQRWRVKSLFTRELRPVSLSA